MSGSLKARASMLVLAVVFAAVALFVVLHGAQNRTAGAQDVPDIPTNPDIGTPTPGGFTSDNVEYVGLLQFPDGEGGAPIPGQPQEILTSTGANIQGDYLYLTSWKSISIYDISDPLNPKLSAYQPIGFMFENENVATDGEILLFSEELPGNALHVYDVSDKTKIE